MASMTPDFLSKFLFWRRERHNRRQQLNGLTKWEYTVNEIRKIIIWENPIKSFACLLGVNVIFWLLINIKLKFYGVIFIALLVMTVNQLWNDQFQRLMIVFDTDSGRDSATSTSSDSRFFSLAEINRCMNSGFEMLRNVCVQLKRLRQEQPGTFCFATCISFLMLSFIGRTISGIALLYTMLTAIMIVPGIIIHVIPSHILNNLIQFIYSSHKEAESDKEEDYIPETNKETLELLRLASDLQTSRNEEEDSIRDLLLEQITGTNSDATESTYSKLSFLPDASIPCMDERSLDFSEFELTEKNSNIGKSVDGDDSDSDINFQSKHFNGDSSEEEEFVKGLKFTDVVDKEDKLESESLPSLLNAASVGLNLLTAGANILSSAVKSSTSSPSGTPETKRHDRESSSDTDSFELISEEDI